MSVATEFPPVVTIPERARTATAPRLPGSRGHLSLVPSSRPESAPLTKREAVRVSTVLNPTTHRSAQTSVASSPLRLTRLGTIALALAVAAVGASLLIVAHLSIGSAATPRGDIHSATVTVQAGDTLWSIAREISPDRDPRVVVDQLVSRNHLASVDLTPGQMLRVA
ncbi:LysM peptidoglycan-binding domain-containing protein [Jatrophihabitans sp. DSM 45814]